MSPAELTRLAASMVNCSCFHSSRASQVSGEISRNFFKPRTLQFGAVLHQPFFVGDGGSDEECLGPKKRVKFKSHKTFGQLSGPGPENLSPRSTLGSVLTIMMQNSTRSINPEPSVSKYSKNSS